MNQHRLSEDHPLRSDPSRPWPYKVLIGYRKSGNRRVVESRAIFIRATSVQLAEAGAMREARQMPMTRDGVRLIASRVVASRPMDKEDRINIGGAA